MTNTLCQVTLFKLAMIEDMYLGLIPHCMIDNYISNHAESTVLTLGTVHSL